MIIKYYKNVEYYDNVYVYSNIKNTVYGNIIKWHKCLIIEV